ncbi:MAG TPA: WecB/TagA/CpsF family glycosyltransferase [Pseudonocardiaceae bacterium]|nr:WecB/TagA/CpsF family glycosyltransferase [Pseudonocardiaceae bacterium]
MRAGIPTLTVLGVPVAVLHADAALAQARALLDNREPALLAYVNAHSLNLAAVDAEYRQILRDADLVLNDGIGLTIAARLQGQAFPANLNGTDFTPRLLAAIGPNEPVFLLGGKPGVAERAAANLAAQIRGLSIAGCAHGYFTDAELPGLLSRIRACKTRILLVGMGNPAQERWLAEHLPASRARLGVAVGAFLDFAAGEVRRAPEWVRQARLEWLYRLGVEPGRLWRRYVLGNPLFLYRVIMARQRQRRHHTGQD